MDLAFSQQPVARRTAHLLALTRDDNPINLVNRGEQSQVAHLVRGGLSCEIGKVGAIINVDGSISIFYGTEMPEGQGWREWDRSPLINSVRGLAFGVREARRFGAAEIAIGDGLNPGNALLAAYYAGSANYAFNLDGVVTAKKTGDSGGPVDLLHMPERLHKLARSGLIIADARNFGRNLMNMPANVLTTEELREQAVRVGRMGGCTVTVMDPEEMFAQGFDLTLSIAAGSNYANPPQVVVLEYFGDPRGRDAPCAVLVGKGVVHDSGGMNLKENSGDMHMDMGGGGPRCSQPCRRSRRSSSR